jgi:hypothetical protein
MNSQEQEAEADEGLSGSLFRIVQDERKIKQLRHELGNFSHRCRNVLSGMKMSLYLLRRQVPGSLPGWWENIEQNYRGIEQLLDELQSIYRPMPLTLVRAPFRSLVRDRESSWRDWFARGRVALEISPPAEEIAGDLDPMCLRMGCDAFLGWRAAALQPGHVGRLFWQTADDWLHACWQESPGVARAPETVLDSLAKDRSTQPTGRWMLALPLLARVVKAHGGSVQWTRFPAFEVRFGWPLEQDAV